MEKPLELVWSWHTGWVGRSLRITRAMWMMLAKLMDSSDLALAYIF